MGLRSYLRIIPKWTQKLAVGPRESSRVELLERGVYFFSPPISLDFATPRYWG